MSATRPGKSSPAPPAVTEPRYERIVSNAITQLSGSLSVTFHSSPFRNLSQRFVIACSPRTGSHLLCQGLLDHGAVVDEFLNVDRIEKVSAKNDISSVQEYCVFIVKKFGVSGVFGVKGGPPIMAPLVLSQEVPNFTSDWKFVFLKRTDILKQSISLYIAGLTGSFTSSKRPTRELTDEDFDGAKIANLIARRIEINDAWEEAFSFYAVEPLRITYEELASDAPGIIARTAEFLDLRGPPITNKRFLLPPFEVQATALNARWENRFREEGW